MLRQYWDLANKVLTNPKKMSKDSVLTFYVSSGATAWEKYNTLFRSYEAQFVSRY